MAQVNDAEKRLNLLFDHLNNEELPPPVTGPLGELSNALQGGEYDSAQGILTSLMTSNAGEGSKWLVGVKKLIAMSKATPK
jgi:protein transport protein SEC31